MKWRACTLALGLTVLFACSPEVGVDTREPVAPITGAQIDSMQRAVREAGIAPAESVSVLRRDEGTRAVVHARRAVNLSIEEQEDLCAGVRAITSPELQAGQKLEIYVIQSDSVAACR